MAATCSRASCSVSVSPVVNLYSRVRHPLLVRLAACGSPVCRPTLWVSIAGSSAAVSTCRSGFRHARPIPKTLSYPGFKLLLSSWQAARWEGAELAMSTNTSRKCATCRQLRRNKADATVYTVAPADGGGWPAWSGALLRLFERIGSQPTRAIIMSQPDLNERYVQAQIGHGIAHTEVGSNVYMTGNSRLTTEHEAFLTRLGWLPPSSDRDDPNEMPANWYLPLIHGDWPFLVDMIVTAVHVVGFVEPLPIEVRTFQCDNPCRDCSWPPESRA